MTSAEMLNWIAPYDCLIKVTLSTTDAQYSGVEFAINGIQRCSVGALAPNSAFSMLQAYEIVTGDIISFQHNSIPGSIAFSVIRK